MPLLFGTIPMLISSRTAPPARLRSALEKQGEMTMKLVKAALVLTLVVGGGLGPGQCGRTEARSQPALHHDHGGHL